MDPVSSSPLRLSKLTAAISISNENDGNLEGTRDGATQDTTDNPIYALQDVPGKEKGLVAVEKIPKGTRILSEEPLITVPRNVVMNEQLKISIYQQVAALSEDQQRAFLSMHNIHPYKNAAERYLGIVRTNSLPAETDGDKTSIFLEACRINHACDNNAQKNWNENIKRHTVHALRDIDKGEEITIYYLGADKSYEARREALWAGFNFTCLCGLCSLPPEQSQKSNKRLEEIHRLDNLIGQGVVNAIVSSSLRILRYVDQQVRLYNEQRPGHLNLSRAFFDAAHIAIANGDLARGRIFTDRAVSVWKTALGGDSPEAIRDAKLAQDLSNHIRYRISTKWKTAVDEIPQGLEPNDFEDWLWKRPKREEPKPKQQVDLRDRATFPGFIDLPDDNDADSKLYESSDVVNSRQRHRWCFVGEIVDFVRIHHLEIEITDLDGRKVPLHFYTDSRGSELANSQLQKGYTVAILDAERHVFKFGDPGIRHEDPRMIKIFPLSLDKLLALNDQVQQFSMEHDGIRRCHGCGKKAASLQRCSKCLFFWYCDRACQMTGWTEKSHKADCKLLKDPGLRGLFLLNWDE